MKVGDKVYIEVEVEQIGKSDNTFTGRTKDGKVYWFGKQDITQLPIQEGRWMMVSFNGVLWKTRFVIGKFKDNFVFITSASNDVELATATGCTTGWKYAKEIPAKRIVTLAEVAKLTGESVDEIEFEKL